jgi:hypothetical protein
MQHWDRKKPSYWAAKEIDQATIEQRQLNYYNMEKEELMAKKREMQRKYKEELDKHLQTREN